MLWLPSDSTVEEIQGICLWPQNLWGHAEFLHEWQEAGKQFTGCWESSFLSVLFVLFWDYTWERVEREFWKVFSSTLPLLPQKYRAKLLRISKGTEANAEYFLISAEEVCLFRNVNAQLNRIVNNTFLKFTLCCYKRAFCLRLKQRFHAKEARLFLPTGCEFIAKAHMMFAAIFFAGSTTLLLCIASITRSQTVFKQHFSTCNLWSICEPRNIWK